MPIKWERASTDARHLVRWKAGKVYTCYNTPNPDLFWLCIKADQHRAYYLPQGKHAPMLADFRSLRVTDNPMTGPFWVRDPTAKEKELIVRELIKEAAGATA